MPQELSVRAVRESGMCFTASTLGLLLDRMKQPFTGLAVEAHAKRRDEHPTVLNEPPASA